jgi:hypothetical protein
MVSMLVSSLVYGGFIGGVMVRGARLESGRSWVHRWCNGTNTPPMNHLTRGENVIHYTTDESSYSRRER